MYIVSYRIAGNFLYGAKFRIFRMLYPLYKNKNCENLSMQKDFPLVRDP